MADDSTAGPTAPVNDWVGGSGGDPQRGVGPLAERLGVRVREATVERLVATMPVAGNEQPYGYLHGGASAVLAESLGSMGAALHAGPDRQAVGIELNATHHRSPTQGLLTGVATPVHLGRTLTTHEIVISDDQGRRVCTARLTCLIKNPR